MINKLNDNDRKNELIHKYYDINEEDKTLNLYYSFNDVSELYDNYYPNEENNIFSNEVIDKISDSIEIVPLTYKVKIIFEVENINENQSKKVLESFNDSIELSLYFARVKRQKRQLFAAILILIGITLIFILTILKSTGVLENELQKDVGSEVVDIMAWVFIWEATTLLFLEKPKEFKHSFQMKNRVKEIQIIDKNTSKVLVNEESSSIFKDLMNETKIKRFGKVTLLGSSIGFIFLVFYNFYASIVSIASFANSSEFNVATLIALIIGYIIAIGVNLLAGVSGLHKYLDKKTKISKFAAIYSVFLIITIIADIISYAQGKTELGVFGFICSIIIQVLYVTGCLIDKFVKE